ncbi:MAG: hypothetical protein KAS75_00075 [Planctomycetes bacterium]|nr:hypothetical protein [Planctomycetota bacterium]
MKRTHLLGFGVSCLILLMTFGCASVAATKIPKGYFPATDPDRQSKIPSSRTVLQGKCAGVEAPKKFYLRIAFFNDTYKKPISPNCRMWIRGFGDFYPARQGDWKFGGTLIEKAGPFDINGENIIHFYPDYSDESKEIKMPFGYLVEMNPKGSVKDMLTISVESETIIFDGTPIEDVNGKSTYKFNRKTCKEIYP